MAASRNILTNVLITEDTFGLIALHSDYPDYQMAYTLNLHLGSQLKRQMTDLNVGPGRSFSVFEWKDLQNDTIWTLLKNESIQEWDTFAMGLFKDEVSHMRHRLIPEHHEVDYFLKIENDENDIEQNLLSSILKIPNVITAYSLQISNLKSKNNLIFY